MTQEMHAFAEHVGGEEQRFGIVYRIYGAVVAYAFEPVVRDGGEGSAHRLYETEFRHVHSSIIYTCSLRRCM